MPRSRRWEIKREFDKAITHLDWVLKYLDRLYGIYAGDGTYRSRELYNLRIKILSIIQRLVEIRDLI
jgi:hypothetical protein